MKVWIILSHCDIVNLQRQIFELAATLDSLTLINVFYWWGQHHITFLLILEQTSTFCWVECLPCLNFWSLRRTTEFWKKVTICLYIVRALWRDLMVSMNKSYDYSKNNRFHCWFGLLAVLSQTWKNVHLSFNLQFFSQIQILSLLSYFALMI